MGTGASKIPTSTRVLYLEIDGKVQRVVFSENCSSRDIKDLIAAAAGVSRWSSLNLKTQDGAILVIEPNMPTNTVRSPYLVWMSPVNMKYGDEEVFQKVLYQIADRFTSTFTVSHLRTEMEKRIQELQGQVHVEGMKAVELQHMFREIDELKEQIHQDRQQRQKEKLKQRGCKPKTHFVHKSIAVYPKYMLSDQTKLLLREPSFNIWHWEPNEMISLIEFMYTDLGLVEEFSIPPTILKRWLMCIQANYRDNPFHNFRHCFCVTQMMYGMIHLCKLADTMAKQDLLILMTASICHDLDHPGYNNTEPLLAATGQNEDRTQYILLDTASTKKYFIIWNRRIETVYQINARTELSIRYNDISPLENHHAAVAFDIISQPECNIFANVSREVFKRIRQEIIMLVLATDMARHSEIVEGFKGKLDTFDFHNDEYLNSLKMMLIKCCDISNEVRPTQVSEPWVDCLLEEYFMQSDREKAEGLPVAPFMDRNKVTKPTAQIGFIKCVLIPLFESMSKLFPQIAAVMINPLREAYDHYEKLRLKEEKMLLDVGSSNTANESKSKTRSSADRKWVGRDTNLPIKEHIPLDNTQKEEKQNNEPNKKQLSVSRGGKGDQ